MDNSITRIKSSLYQNFINMPGWRTNRKIIVIESDDWGSIRMPSNEVYSKFVSRGLNLSNTDYNRIDTLECNDDLMLLFDVLSSVRDSRNNHPVITGNIVVGNPDFKKIKDSDFNNYFFEPVTETLKRYPQHDQVVSLWKQGNANGLFHPQFHGREHVNIVRWIDALKTKTQEMMFTFENETTFSGDGDYSFMEVLDFNTLSDLEIMKESLSAGLDLFEKIFEYRSESFIPPCYTWSSEIEDTLYKKGVKYIQGLVVQSVPTGSFGNYTKKYHYMGSRNIYGQYFLTRNCFFEPSLSKSNDPVGECLRRINMAFRWKKPAVISTHRINFMGSLDEKNRNTNLKLFKYLLDQILMNWTDVEFMSSDQLGDLIAQDKVVKE
ncbi:MAG: hypothetical protein WCE64_15085 [Bacteroidales bacterium]